MGPVDVKNTTSYRMTLLGKDVGRISLVSGFYIHSLKQLLNVGSENDTKAIY